MITVKFKNPQEVKVKIAKKGNNLKDFAEENGISQSYLSQLLNGTHNPSVKMAYKIARGLNAELEEIFLISNIDISIKEVSQ